MHAQAEQLHRGLAALDVALLLGQRLPLPGRQPAQRTAGRQADGPQPGIKPRLQQARFTTHQYTAVESVNVQVHQGLPAGIRGGPWANCCGMLRWFDPFRQRSGQGLAEVRGQFIKPGTGDLLALQTEQAVQCARCGLCVLGRVAAVAMGVRAEIHKAATEAEQDGGQAGCGLGQGFGERHMDVPEIA
ncbi:hypothetical protein D3C80_1028800 [compost metagenome]